MNQRRHLRPAGRLRELSAARRGGVYLVPNMITTAGLFCGIFAIVQVMQGHYPKAALAVLAAQVFDMLDGRVARMTNTSSRFGIEYDSLCDLVSFGVAPGLLIYRWALIPWGAWGWLAIALYVTCSALRLARFNVLVGDATPGSFTGLPVPAASATLASVVLMYRYVGHSGLPDKHIALLLTTYVLAALMVSNIPYPSFKNLKLHRRQPLWLLVAGVVFLKVLIAEYQLVIFLIITTYVASGPVGWVWATLRAGDEEGEGVEEDEEAQAPRSSLGGRRGGGGFG
jgi:CDP-diacylglycerol--serine O-phosphatidyltransferase